MTGTILYIVITYYHYIVMTYALSGGAQSGAPISQLHWLTGAPDGAPPKFAYKNVRYAINGVPYLQDHRRQL